MIQIYLQSLTVSQFMELSVMGPHLYCFRFYPLVFLIWYVTPTNVKEESISRNFC